MDIPKPSRTCSVSGRDLLPGEVFFSALTEQGQELRRRDVGAEHWAGPPDEFFAWWKTRVPDADEKKVRLAPNDILMNLFEQARTEPEQADMAYVLALLLVRRRLLRYEREENDADGRKMLVVYAVKENATYEIPAVTPDRQRLEEVQEELSRLLYS